MLVYHLDQGCIEPRLGASYICRGDRIAPEIAKTDKQQWYLSPQGGCLRADREVPFYLW